MDEEYTIIQKKMFSKLKSNVKKNWKCRLTHQIFEKKNLKEFLRLKNRHQK